MARRSRSGPVNEREQQERGRCNNRPAWTGDREQDVAARAGEGARSASSAERYFRVRLRGGHFLRPRLDVRVGTYGRPDGCLHSNDLCIYLDVFPRRSRPRLRSDVITSDV